MTPAALANEPVVDDPLGEGLRALLPVLAMALTAKDVRVRRAALDVLDVLGPVATPASPAVARVLTDTDPFVRWSAVARWTPLVHRGRGLRFRAGPAAR